jgi:hypothetical protein
MEALLGSVNLYQTGERVNQLGRAIVPNGSTRRASVGVLWLVGCFVLLVAVAPRETIKVGGNDQSRAK